MDLDERAGTVSENDGVIALLRFSTDYKCFGGTSLFLAGFPLTQIFVSRVSGEESRTGKWSVSGNRPTESTDRSWVRSRQWGTPPPPLFSDGGDCPTSPAHRQQESQLVSKAHIRLVSRQRLDQQSLLVANAPPERKDEREGGQQHDHPGPKKYTACYEGDQRTRVAGVPYEAIRPAADQLLSRLDRYSPREPRTVVRTLVRIFGCEN
jgi:hypothetical protein